MKTGVDSIQRAYSMYILFLQRDFEFRMRTAPLGARASYFSRRVVDLLDETAGQEIELIQLGIR